MRDEPPEGLEIRQDGESVEVIYPWGRSGWALVAVLPGWLLGLTFATVLMLNAPTPVPTHIWLFTAAFHVVTSVPAAYMTAAGYLNSTTLRLSPTGGQARSGPVPWYGDRTWSRGDLVRFFVVQALSRHRQPLRSWSVFGLTLGGAPVRLVSGLSDPAQAEWIVRQLVARA